MKKWMAALLAMLTLLASCGVEPEPREPGKWVDVETDYRPVKAFSVVSQPEIFYCSALGQEPDLSGVVFRLEYEDGGVEETGFVDAREVRYWYENQEGSWINYGMVLRWNPEPTLGKRREAVFFNNAQFGGTHHHADASYEDLVREDSTEYVRAYVDAYNLTIEEYLEKYPAYQLLPGRPAQHGKVDARIEAAAFTPEKDGIYLFCFSGGCAEMVGCNLMVLGSEGQWADFYEYRTWGWSYELSGFALRLGAGETITIFYRILGYLHSIDGTNLQRIEESPLELSVLPLETHRLRVGERIDFEGGCVIVPEIPPAGRYFYRVNGAYPIPLGTLEGGLGGWSPVYYRRGNASKIWEVTCSDPVWWEYRGTLHPYEIYDTDSHLLVPYRASWELGEHDAEAFVLVAPEGAAAVEFARGRAVSARDITLRVGGTVLLSEIFTWDRDYQCVMEITGTEDAVTMFEQDGVTMLRAENPGQAHMRIKVFQFDETITITVTE